MSQPTVENANALLKKISINVLGQDAEQTRFTLPLEGILLTKDQLDAYLGKGTFASWFNHRRDGADVPMDWIARLPKGEIALAEEFEAEGVEIIVPGKKPIVFETVEADEDDDEAVDQPAGRITNIVLKPTAGGMTLMSFHLQVSPGLGDDNLTLQEHQYRRVTLTLGDLTLSERKGRQQALPLDSAAPATNGQEAAAH
jgi:hypothetical protein